MNLKPKSIIIAIVILFIGLVIGILVPTSIFNIDRSIEQPSDLLVPSPLATIPEESLTNPSEWIKKEFIYKSNIRFDNAKYPKYTSDELIGVRSSNYVEETYANYFVIELPADFDLTFDYEHYNAKNEKFKPNPCIKYVINNPQNNTSLILKEIYGSVIDCNTNVSLQFPVENINELTDYFKLNSNSLYKVGITDNKSIIRTSDKKLTNSENEYYYFTLLEDGNKSTLWKGLTFGPGHELTLTLDVSIVSNNEEKINEQDLEIFDKIISSFKYERTELIDAKFISKDI